MTVEELKEELRNRKARKNTKIGTYAEYLYANVLIRNGHEVQFMRREGHDVVIDGSLKVDLKASLRLGERSHLGAPKWPGAGRGHSRKAEILYHRAMFYEDAIVLGSSVIDDPIGLLQASWEEAVEIVVGGSRLGGQEAVPASLHLVGQRRVLRHLRNRVRATWGLNAKVVYRDNPKAQKGMGKWGPESFYLYESQLDSSELVVLVYFNGSDVDKVFAYPKERLDEVGWVEKSVGSNPNNRKTFDPVTLDAKFKFKSLEQFEAEFRSRFLRD